MMRRVCTTWITVPLKPLIILYEIDTLIFLEKYKLGLLFSSCRLKFAIFIMFWINNFNDPNFVFGLTDRGDA